MQIESGLGFLVTEKLLLKVFLLCHFTCLYLGGKAVIKVHNQYCSLKVTDTNRAEEGSPQLGKFEVPHFMATLPSTFFLFPLSLFI